MTRRNEQTRCSMGPSIKQQDAAMKRLLDRKAKADAKSEGRRGETPFADVFAANFARLRAHYKISLEEMAERTGITKSYLAEISWGKAPGISLEYACRIADALNQPLLVMTSSQARVDRAPLPSSSGRAG